MALSAKLNIQGINETVDVLECDFGFQQETDYSGKPSARPSGGMINLVIESISSDALVNWMVSATEKKEGEIAFYRKENESAFKKVSFKEGICVSYHEYFNSHDDFPMTIAISISSREIKIGMATAFKQIW
ncbi:MAG: type VI secretion system tube protein TssD [Bacteroidota bacterium]|nr:type VI secretion system tube protein TssD [Bacteroidota bacterium]